MIRKFFAFLFLLVFVAVIAPLAILQSLSSSFLNKENLLRVVVPKSYDNAIGFIADYAAKTPQEAGQYSERLRKALDKQTYIDVADTAIISMADVIDEFEKGAREAEIDFVPLKNKLKEVLPDILKKLPQCERAEMSGESFRFCIPPQFVSGQNSENRDQTESISLDRNLESSIIDGFENQIPRNMTVDISKNPELSRILPFVLLIYKFLPLIIAAFSLFLLGVTALLVYSPWTSVMRWISAAIIALSGFLALLIVTLFQLPEILFVAEGGGSDNKLNMFMFIIKEAFNPLQFWTYIMAAAAIAMFILSFILTKKSKKQSQK